MSEALDTRRSPLRVVADVLFGGWFLLVFTVCVLICLLGILVVPGLERRQRIAKTMSQLVFLLTATGPDCEGFDQLPEGPCVLVANHQSYLDGVVMTAALPPRVSFVIKAEMRDVPLAGWLLVRIDSFFVKRDDKRASASAARQILKAARAGRALGFFPEGTFQDYTGIHPFRRGAFAAAKAGKLPIVPVALTGTRDILRCYRWWPRIGRIRIKMLPPITAEDVDQLSAGQLADRARQMIMSETGERDLVLEPVESAA
ncbi:MAG: lysophospholipid acyltransferase family protein [Pseudomonadota bacterium]